MGAPEQVGSRSSPAAAPSYGPALAGSDKTQGVLERLKEHLGFFSGPAAKGLKGRVTKGAPEIEPVSSRVFQRSFACVPVLNQNLPLLRKKAEEVLEQAPPHIKLSRELIGLKRLREALLQKGERFESKVVFLEETFDLSPDGTKENLERTLAEEHSKVTQCILYDTEKAGAELGLEQFNKYSLYMNVGLRFISLEERYNKVLSKALDRIEKMETESNNQALQLVAEVKKRLNIKEKKTPKEVMEQLQESLHFLAISEKREQYNKEIRQIIESYLSFIAQIDNCAAQKEQYREMSKRVDELLLITREIKNDLNNYECQKTQLTTLLQEEPNQLQNIEIYLAILITGEDVIYPFEMLGKLMEDLQSVKKDHELTEFCKKVEGVCKEHMLQRVEVWANRTVEHVMSFDKASSPKELKDKKGLLNDLINAETQLEKWRPYFVDDQFNERFNQNINAINFYIDLGSNYVDFFDFNIRAQGEPGLKELESLKEQISMLKESLTKYPKQIVQMQALAGVCQGLLLSLESQQTRHRNDLLSIHEENLQVMKDVNALLNTFPEGDRVLDNNELSTQLEKQIKRFSELGKKIGHLIEKKYIEEGQVESLEIFLAKYQKLQRFLDGMQRLTGSSSSIRSADVEQLGRALTNLGETEQQQQWIKHAPGWISALENKLQNVYLSNESALIREAKEKLKVDKFLLAQVEKRLDTINQRNELFEEGPLLAEKNRLQQSIANFPKKCEDALGLTAQDALESSLHVLAIRLAKTDVLVYSLFSYWEDMESDALDSLIKDNINDLESVRMGLTSLQSTREWEQLQESGKKSFLALQAESDHRIDLLKNFAVLKEEILQDLSSQTCFAPAVKGMSIPEGMRDAQELCCKVTQKVVQIQDCLSLMQKTGDLPSLQQGIEAFKGTISEFSQKLEDTIGEFISEMQYRFAEDSSTTQKLKNFNAQVQLWKNTPPSDLKKLEALDQLFALALKP